MANAVVKNAEFGKSILEEIMKKYITGKTVKGPKAGFVHTNISLDFIVLATENNVKDPCCVCYRTSAGIICSGDCCAEVIDSVHA